MIGRCQSLPAVSNRYWQAAQNPLQLLRSKVLRAERSVSPTVELEDQRLAVASQISRMRGVMGHEVFQIRRCVSDSLLPALNPPPEEVDLLFVTEGDPHSQPVGFVQQQGYRRIRVIADAIPVHDKTLNPCGPCCLQMIAYDGAAPGVVRTDQGIVDRGDVAQAFRAPLRIVMRTRPIPSPVLPGPRGLARPFLDLKPGHIVGQQMRRLARQVPGSVRIGLRGRARAGMAGEQHHSHQNESLLPHRRRLPSGSWLSVFGLSVWRSPRRPASRRYAGRQLTGRNGLVHAAGKARRDLAAIAGRWSGKRVPQRKADEDHYQSDDSCGCRWRDLSFHPYFLLPRCEGEAVKWLLLRFPDSRLTETSRYCPDR